MNLKLFYRLLLSLFSFRKGNMRYPNLRRICAVSFIIPMYIVLLVVNRVFLLLDYVFFPSFLNTAVKAPVFIVSAPRSGATFLFHALSKRDDFTSFCLWEMIFAPSITQKYIFLFLAEVDKMFGQPLYWFVQCIDNKVLSKNPLHRIGLLLPEEDEALLLWDINSIFLYFMNPDSNFMDAYLEFDYKVPEPLRRKIMKGYRRYIQRHNFVHNPDNSKRFLSKNPVLMCKLRSLYAEFPDSRVINLNRSPDKTIPSAIALNDMFYKMITSQKPPLRMVRKKKGMLVKWYQMAEDALNREYLTQHLKIDFHYLINGNPTESRRISHFLNIQNFDLRDYLSSQTMEHKSKSTYKPLNSSELKSVLEEIPFMHEYCR
jgi:hypothetical protein